MSPSGLQAGSDLDEPPMPIETFSIRALKGGAVELQATSKLTSADYSDFFAMEMMNPSLSDFDQLPVLRGDSPPPPPDVGPGIIVVGRSLDTNQGGLLGYLYLGFGNQSGGGGTVLGGWKPYNPPPQPNPREEVISEAINHLKQNHELTESDIARMDAYGIKLSEVLRPGIFQAEFDVVKTGLASVGEHREWVRVFNDGHTELLTAGPSSNGELDLRLTSFEQDGHGLKHVNSKIRFYGVAPTIENQQLATER